MKILHILKTEPDQNTKTLMDILSGGEDVTVYKLYEGDPDYEELVDLVFQNDRTISWW